MFVIFIIGLFGFFGVDKVVNIKKDNDLLMQTIKEKKESYSIEPIEAIVNNDTIIPGKNGKKININSSYNNMKKLGEFNDVFFVYDEVKPDTKLKNNYDKYIISGNKSKKEIALVFDSDDRYLNDILNILKINDIKANFLIDGLWGENNIETIDRIGKHNDFINKGYNNEYSEITLLYTNGIINKFNHSSFCFLEEKNKDVINLCKSKKMGTILSVGINFKDYTKINLENGKILYLKIKDIKQLNLLIKYIKQKGYKIVTLKELLQE